MIQLRMSQVRFGGVPSMVAMTVANMALATAARGGPGKSQKPPANTPASVVDKKQQEERKVKQFLQGLAQSDVVQIQKQEDSTVFLKNLAQSDQVLPSLEDRAKAFFAQLAQSGVTLPKPAEDPKAFLKKLEESGVDFPKPDPIAFLRQLSEREAGQT